MLSFFFLHLGWITVITVLLQKQIIKGENNKQRWVEKRQTVVCSLFSQIYLNCRSPRSILSSSCVLLYAAFSPPLNATVFPIIHLIVAHLQAQASPPLLHLEMVAGSAADRLHCRILASKDHSGKPWKGTWHSSLLGCLLIPITDLCGLMESTTEKVSGDNGSDIAFYMPNNKTAP